MTREAWEARREEENVHQKRIESEKNLLMLAGAIMNSEIQVNFAHKHRHCALCKVEIVEDEVLKRMVHGLREMEKQAAQTEHLSVRKQCFERIAELRQSTVKEAMVLKKNPKEWMAVEMREGQVKALRRQKAVTLRDMHCACCGRAFENEDGIRVFLEATDKRITYLANRVHVHMS